MNKLNDSSYNHGLLDQYNVELVLKTDGSVDIDHYRAKAEALRAAYLKALFASAVQRISNGIKKAFSTVKQGQAIAPRTHIVSSQKLTLSI